MRRVSHSLSLGNRGDYKRGAYNLLLRTLHNRFGKCTVVLPHSRASLLGETKNPRGPMSISLWRRERAAVSIKAECALVIITLCVKSVFMRRAAAYAMSSLMTHTHAFVGQGCKRGNEHVALTKCLTVATSAWAREWATWKKWNFSTGLLQTRIIANQYGLLGIVF